MTAVVLRDVVSVTGGGTPRKSVSAYYGGGLPWVTPKDMKRRLIGESEITLTEAGVKSSAAKLVTEKSVLVVVRSGVLKHSLPVALTSRPVTLNQDLKALTPKPCLDASYLAWLIKALQPRVLTWVRATTADNFPIDKLLAVEFDLPPMAEQRRIAAILDQADALRAKRRQVLVHLDALAKSVFHELFEDLEATSTVGDVAAIQGGLQISAKRSQLPVQVPYLRVANVHRGRLDLSELKLLRATDAEIDRTRLESDDLLFVEGHANSQEIGRVAIWTGEIETCVHQNHLIRGRLDQSQVLPVFAAAWFNSQTGAAHFRRAGATTSGLHTISSSTVRSAPLPVPSMASQRNFAVLVHLINSQRRRLHEAQEADDLLFASLQSRAFRGEL